MGIVQQNSGTFNGTSFTATLGATSSASNTLYLIVCGNTIINTPASWTLRTSQVNFMGHYAYSRTGVAISSVAVTNSSGQGTWWLIEVNGAYDTATSANDSGGFGSYTAGPLTPTAGTRTLLASIGSVTSGATVRTVSGWTSSFIEQIDVCQASADYPMQGGAALTDITASGSASYSTTATYSTASIGRSSIILSSASSAGGGGPTPVAATDTATVTDTATDTATTAGSDTATVTDTASDAATTAGADAATAADTSAVLRALPGVTDAATVTDTGAEAATLAGADTATVTDSRSWAATVGLTEAGTVTEVVSLAATRASTDSGALSDQSAVVVGGVTLGRADAAALAGEAGALTAALPLLDAGTMADATSSSVTDTATDTSALSDASVVSVNGTTVSVAELGTLSEARTLTAALGVQDGTTVAELLTLAVTAAAVTDQSVLTDQSALAASAQRATVDSWTLTESKALTAALAVVEQLAGTELGALVATLAGADQATLAELGLVALPAADVPPALLHAGGRDRWRAVGRVLGMAARGRAARYAAHGKQ